MIAQIIMSDHIKEKNLYVQQILDSVQTTIIRVDGFCFYFKRKRKSTFSN